LKPLAVGFAGTPAFAALALDRIAAAGFTIPLVLTRPDKPKGRGLKLEASPVAQLAGRLGLPVLKPASLKAETDRAAPLAVPLDVLVVAAYGLILPQAVLDWPRHGCLNIHASLLPRWRGAAPIARAIEAGDATSGISIMQMDAGLDTGAVIDTVAVPIGPRDTAGSLHNALAAAGADAVVEVLRRLDRERTLAATPQPSAGATYAKKIAREDAALDWTLDAEDLDRRIRAFDPVPGAHASFRGEVVKAWRAEPGARSVAAPPGEVLAVGPAGVDVACGSGLLRLVELQPAGGRRMDAAAWASGRAVAPGQHFGP